MGHLPAAAAAQRHRVFPATVDPVAAADMTTVTVQAAARVAVAGPRAAQDRAAEVATTPMATRTVQADWAGEAITTRRGESANNPSWAND